MRNSIDCSGRLMPAESIAALCVAPQQIQRSFSFPPARFCEISQSVDFLHAYQHRNASCTETTLRTNQNPQPEDQVITTTLVSSYIPMHWQREPSQVTDWLPWGPILSVAFHGILHIRHTGNGIWHHGMRALESAAEAMLTEWVNSENSRFARVFPGV